MSIELASLFEGVAAKRLAAVEVNPNRSNQHELQATKPVQKFLGPAVPQRSFEARLLYLNDDSEPVVDRSRITYYDSREKHPTRSEPRLYYPASKVMALASEGDVIFVGKLADGQLVIIVAAEYSSAASQLLWLFGLHVDNRRGFTAAEEDTLADSLSAFDAEVLLEWLEIEPVIAENEDSDLVASRFGDSFPTTAEFSAFARSHADAPDPRDDPDGALLAWWDCEYRLFQAFERNIVESRLAEGFLGDDAVEDFLRFSLSVQNRRKSRSGHAFENHLAQIFVELGIPFVRGAQTERKAKPDFLMPDAESYRDPRVDPSTLRMLGAKTSAKDRWRQILTEADRIPQKHLATLQPAISEDQTSEMEKLGVQLVVPRALHVSYTDKQRLTLLTVADFVCELRVLFHRE